jgi:hypothetical protein
LGLFAAVIHTRADARRFHLIFVYYGRPDLVRLSTRIGCFRCGGVARAQGRSAKSPAQARPSHRQIGQYEFHADAAFKLAIETV